MSAFTAAACRLLNYRCQITSLGIVRKARSIIPGNGFPCQVSTTCYRLSDDDKSGVDPKQGVKKTLDVKAQIFTHGNAVLHKQICKSLFGDGANKLFRMMSERKIMFKVVEGTDNVEVIATSDERLEQAKQMVEKEVEDIKSKLKIVPTANDSAYEEKVLFDWDSAIPTIVVRRGFIGVKGNNIKRIIDQFESKVSIQVREDHIMINGKEEELVKAATIKVKEELNNTVSRCKSNYLPEGVPATADKKQSLFSAKVDAQEDNVKEIVGHIIGAKGVNIRRLKKQAGFYLKVLSGPDYVDVEVNDEANLEKAVQLVTKEIEAFKQNSSVDIHDTASVPSLSRTIKIGEGMGIIFGRLIGKKGDNANRLRQQIGIEFSIKKMDTTTIVVGVNDPADLDKAVEEVTMEIEAIKQKSSADIHDTDSDPSLSRTIQVDDETGTIYGRLIGKSGSRVKHLRQQIGVNFNIEKMDSTTIVVGVNDPADLDKAVEEVTKKIEAIKQTSSVDIHDTASDPSLSRTIKIGEGMGIIFGRLIGKKGDNANRLRQQIGVNFNIEKMDSTTIVVGVNDPADLDKAVEEVTKEIEAIKQRSFADIHETDSDPSLSRTIQIDDEIGTIFGRLIGKNGRHLKHLRQQIGIEFSVKRKDDSVVVSAENPADLDVAFEEVTKEIETIKQTSSGDIHDTASDPSLSRTIQIDNEIGTIFSRLIGKKGENVNRVRQRIGIEFSIKREDDSIVVTVKNPADLDVAFEEVSKDIETIKQTSSVTIRFPKTDVDWDKVFNGEMERLGIFEKSDLLKESPRIECPLWDKLEAEERRERKRAFHVNNFDRMISLTEEGKLWKFPINNDQGWTEEEDVSFGEHVFLDHLIEDFPKQGPLRHFMELVISGLSKNPHMTVKEKHDHINWYRTYFIENEDLMREELGEEHGTIRETIQHV